MIPPKAQHCIKKSASDVPLIGVVAGIVELKPMTILLDRVIIVIFHFHGSVLTVWETQFLLSLAERGTKADALSYRQKRVLNRIFRKAFGYRAWDDWGNQLKSRSQMLRDYDDYSWMEELNHNSFF